MSTIAEQLQTIAENIPKVYEAGQRNGSGGSIDVTAQPGQTIIVKEVDENGKPTKWESAEYQPRTHWTGECIILPETTVEIPTEGDSEGIGMLPAFALVGGEKYTVHYNGTTYVCECRDLGEMIGLGNFTAADETLPNNNEPFVLGCVGGVYLVMPIDGSATVTVSITGMTATPIPVQYVTNALPYIVEITGDDPYVCADTVAELTNIYNSGRGLILRRSATAADGSTVYMYYHLYFASLTNEGLVLAFDSSDVTANSGNLYMTLKPKEDGTYEVSDRSPYAG